MGTYKPNSNWFYNNTPRTDFNNFIHDYIETPLSGRSQFLTRFLNKTRRVELEPTLLSFTNILNPYSPKPFNRPLPPFQDPRIKVKKTQEGGGCVLEGCEVWESFPTSIYIYIYKKNKQREFYRN